jgi:hypothetical protein
MNSKLRSSLIGLSALALVLTGTLYAPSQAAKKLPKDIYQQFMLNAASNSPLTAAQLGTLRSKLTNSSHLTEISCSVRHARNISAADVERVTRSATAACSAARKQTKNLRLDRFTLNPDKRLTGTNYTLEIVVDIPRTVSFAFADGINTSLPKESKILKFNEAYKLPSGPSTVVSGGSFVGWNTKDDGRGVDYQAGQTIRVKYATKLYPKYVGDTINFNILSLDTSVGSNYQLLYYSPGDENYQRPVFSESQPAFVTTERNTITMYVPGFLVDTSAITVTNGLSVAFAGGGTCPDISAVDNQCSSFTITYTTSGTVTFDFDSYTP